MTEIPDPPTQHTCAGCHSVLSWLYSPKTRAWICVIPVDDTSFRLHGCRHAQDPATWRHVRRPDPPSADYLAAKAALTKTSTEGDEN